MTAHFSGRAEQTLQAPIPSATLSRPVVVSDQNGTLFVTVAELEAVSTVTCSNMPYLVAYDCQEGAITSCLQCRVVHKDRTLSVSRQ